MSTTTKVILITILISLYVFCAYHVFVGLIQATAAQGFGGIILIAMGLVLTVKFTIETINE
jgi:hypothetical protein